VRNIFNTNVLTKIVDVDNNVTRIDITNVPFISNCNILEVLSLVAKEGEEKVNLLFNSKYHHQRPHMNKEQTEEFPYPCTQNVNVRDEISCFWYSNTNERGHFVPKVIFSRKCSGVYLDENGEYGMAEDCGGIIDSVENLPFIMKALKSEHFIKHIMGFRDALGDRYNKKIIATFRKDFWKEFLG